MITVDLLMSTHPCENWPRSRVERLVPKMDCSSWTAFAASAKASRWRRVSIGDLTLFQAKPFEWDTSNGGVVSDVDPAQCAVMLHRYLRGERLDVVPRD